MTINNIKLTFSAKHVETEVLSVEQFKNLILNENNENLTYSDVETFVKSSLDKVSKLYGNTYPLDSKVKTFKKVFKLGRVVTISEVREGIKLNLSNVKKAFAELEA